MRLETGNTALQSLCAVEGAGVAVVSSPLGAAFVREAAEAVLALRSGGGDAAAAAAVASSTCEIFHTLLSCPEGRAAMLASADDAGSRCVSVPAAITAALSISPYGDRIRLCAARCLETAEADPQAGCKGMLQLAVAALNAHDQSEEASLSLQGALWLGLFLGPAPASHARAAVLEANGLEAAVNAMYMLNNKSVQAMACSLLESLLDLGSHPQGEPAALARALEAGAAGVASSILAELFEGAPDGELTESHVSQVGVFMRVLRVLVGPSVGTVRWRRAGVSESAESLAAFASGRWGPQVAQHALKVLASLEGADTSVRDSRDV